MSRSRAILLAAGLCLAGVFLSTEAVSAAGVALEGVVVDAAGKPIAGATVTVEVRGFMGLPDTSRSGRSDAEGSFRIEDVPPGTVGLFAQAPGWQNGRVDGLELRTDEDKRGVEIVLSPAAVLKGRVLSSAGRAVPGAEVRLAREDLLHGYHATSSDAEGRYVLDHLPPGSHTVEAMQNEQGSARRQVELRVGENSLDIALKAGREVSGRVVDDAGMPVEGAQLWLFSEGAGPWTTQSRGDGSFRFAAVADGSHRMGVEKEGFAQPDTVPVAVEGSSVTGLEIRLSRGGAIVGRIRGIDLADLARIRIQALGNGSPSAKIEADGSYRIDLLREGEWQVRVELPGTSLYAEGRVQLEPGAEARLDLEMRRGLELSGRVRRAGAPVAGESLFLVGPKRTFAETDAEGRFRFQGLPAGAYDLQVGSARDPQTIVLWADREITIDLPAAPAEPVEGALE